MLERVVTKLESEHPARDRGFNSDGANRSAGGVLHAVTSTAQTLDDTDEAYEMERRSLQAMLLAAAFQR